MKFQTFTVFVLLNTGLISMVYAASPPQTSAEFTKKYQAIAEGATEAVRQGIGKLYDSVNSTDSPDERNLQGFVTSTEVVTFKDIPAQVDAQISEIRTRIKTIILAAATDIEQTGSSGTVNFAEGELSYLPRDAKEKYQRLMEAKKMNNVSIRSVNLAVQMLSDLNQKLIEAAQQESNIDRRNHLYITQAAYVFEMADIVLEILDKIGLEGKQDIERLYQDYQTKVTTRQQEITQELSEIAQSEQRASITKEYADQLRASYDHMQKANEIGLQAWDTVMSKVKQQESWLNNTKKMRDTIRFKRNEAQKQLQTLRDLGVLRGVDKIVSNMEQLVTTVGSMALLTLDEKTVRCLVFGSQASDCSDL